MLILLSVLLAIVFGLAASFAMSWASNFSAVANLAFGAAFVVILAAGLFLIVFVAERVVFPSL